MGEENFLLEARVRVAGADDREEGERPGGNQRRAGEAIAENTTAVRTSVTNAAGSRRRNRRE